MKTKKATVVPSETAPIRTRSFRTSVEIAADALQVHDKDRDPHLGASVLDLRCAATMLPIVLDLLPPTGNPAAAAAREEIVADVVHVLRTMGL